MEVNKNGIIYYFKKQKKELNDMFYERCRIAANKNPTNELELQKAIKESKKIINTKYFNCKYE